MNLIDNLLNRVTMYRLAFYELAALLLVAGDFSLLGMFSFAAANLAFSAAFIFVVTWIANRVFAFAFDAPYNPESAWITALILVLVITPPAGLGDENYFILAFWASALAIASKYILAYRRKHLFNPAAFGIAVTSIFLGVSASWWVGTPVMAPFVVVGGLLVVRKIRRFDLWTADAGIFGAGIAYLALSGSTPTIAQAFSQSFLYAPIFFFSTVMLTEPQTTPPTRRLRIFYGALAGFLLLPNIHIGSFYFTPELALLAANLFAFAVSPKIKLNLVLKEKIQLSHDIWEFVFSAPRRFAFAPGQYLEWTLAHESPDSRSIRRYFTIASSPTEKDIRLGVKVYEPLSSFKRALLALAPEDTVVASGLAGDFTLPKNTNEKLVFIAGGIGITPFRSMLQYLLDGGEKRDITILYSNKVPQDAVYRELLARAERELGVRIVYVFTNLREPLPIGDTISVIDSQTIAKSIPDWHERTFYLSGPQGMVASFKRLLRAMGVPRLQIRTDYFPGFA